MSDSFISIGSEVIPVRPDDRHEYVIETAQVARGYGVDETAIRHHKSRHADELIQGKHYIEVQNTGVTNCYPGKNTGKSTGMTNCHAGASRGESTGVTNCYARGPRGKSTRGADCSSGAKTENSTGVTNCYAGKNSGQRHGNETITLWTKRGVVRLGFFIRSERARMFRDAAEDLIVLDRAQLARNVLLQQILLDVPAEWKRTFSDEWFSAVLGVWGLEYVKARTPGFLGKIITDYVYEPLLAGLPAELKAQRAACGKDNAMLHQFLSTQARDKLTTHLRVVEALAMNCQARPEDFREMCDRTFGGRDQMLLGFSSRRKERAK